MAGAYSASQELVEGHGEAIAIAEWSENAFGIRRGFIEVEDAVEKLNSLYDNRVELAARSRRSREFSLAYDWKRIIDQWDVLLRNIGNRRQRIAATAHRAVSLASVAPRLFPKIDGVNIQVNVVQRQYGRLEANLLSDLRGGLSDARVPAFQQPCQIGRLRVPRRPGHLGVAAGDEEVFLTLKRIFPILDGWMPLWACLSDSVCDGLTVVRLDTWQAARYELAQSVLLLNSSGDLPDELLVDAGLFGVACVGSGASEVQQKLWPELVAEDERDAASLARELLTNPARLRRLAEQAAAECRRLYAPDEATIMDCLRRLHQEEKSAPLTSIA